MANTRYCLQCDDGTKLQHGVHDLCGQVQGVAYAVKGVAGWHCPTCGEVEFDPGSDGAIRLSAAMRNARQAALLEQAAQLRATRRKLKLTQAEAGKLFGGGVSAFSEYERGKTQPHRSTVLLLKLLGQHPELLAEVR